MKKLSLVFCLILILTVTTPASAGKHTWEGDPLPVGEEFAEFPANTTTWINCFIGATAKPMEYPRGGIDCTLEIDGQLVKESFKWNFPYEDERIMIWFWTFPEGLTGVHTFTFHVYLSCAEALEQGFVSSCPNPKASVEVDTIKSTITFIE